MAKQGQQGQGQGQKHSDAAADPPQDEQSLLDQMLDDAAASTIDPELPLVSFSNTVEEPSGAADFTSLGFAKVHAGWSCIGYLIGQSIVDSEFDSEAGRRKQRVFHLRGTVRAMLQDSDTVGEVQGTVKMPQYARLRESLIAVLQKEREEKKKIPIKITYMGQGPDTFVDGPEGRQKKRSGAHIWDVRRVKLAAPSDQK